jgi:DUF4097 and DUF4098 domain-containing protein YvlB
LFTGYGSKNCTNGNSRINYENSYKSNIKRLIHNAQVSVKNNDINEITWHNGTPPIPKEQILAIIPQVELDIAMENLRAKRNKLLSRYRSSMH